MGKGEGTPKDAFRIPPQSHLESHLAVQDAHRVLPSKVAAL
jgi:hypothetical protein